MILVTTGTNGVAFNRLLRSLPPPEGEEIVVQHGPSLVRPQGCRCVDYLPYDDLRALVREARVVVTHGGVGSILLSLAEGKKPVVVPRLARYSEVVDDHQLTLGRRLARDGRVLLAEDETQLAEILRSRDFHAETVAASTRLVNDIRSFIDSVAPPRVAQSA